MYEKSGDDLIMSRKDYKKYDCFGKSKFHLKDNEYNFTLDIIELLKMLQDSVLFLELPKIPEEWVKETEKIYGIKFEDNITESVVSDE